MKAPERGSFVETADAVSDGGYSTEEDDGDERRDTLILGSVLSKLGTVGTLARRARLIVQDLFPVVQVLYHTGKYDGVLF